MMKVLLIAVFLVFSYFNVGNGYKVPLKDRDGKHKTPFDPESSLDTIPRTNGQMENTLSIRYYDEELRHLERMLGEAPVGQETEQKQQDDNRRKSGWTLCERNDLGCIMGKCVMHPTSNRKRCECDQFFSGPRCETFDIGNFEGYED